MRKFYELAVKDKLERYVYAKACVGDLEVKIEQLKAMEKNKNLIGKYGLSNGGGSCLSQEDIILNINAEIEELENNYKFNMYIIQNIEKAMIGLSDEEKEITLTVHGNRKRENKIYKLSCKYHYEKSQLYRIANDGLRHISLKLYGNE